MVGGKTGLKETTVAFFPEQAGSPLRAATTSPLQITREKACSLLFLLFLFASIFFIACFPFLNLLYLVAGRINLTLFNFFNWSGLSSGRIRKV